MSKVVFRKLQHDSKLPLYPKTCTKLVGYGNRVIDYLGTTKMKCKHNDTEMDLKVILGLRLCIELALIIIQCDDTCMCKTHIVAETGATVPIEVEHTRDDIDSTPGPIPLDTKIDETNAKEHIMRLCPDLFTGVGTIKDAVVHLDVKPGATPIVCSPR